MHPSGNPGPLSPGPERHGKVELNEQPRHEPGSQPEAITREVKRGGRERWVIDDPRIVFIPRAQIRELCEANNASFDAQTGQVTFSHLHAPGMDDLADRIGKFKWYEIDRNRAQYAKNELYEAQFPYVTKSRFTNYEARNSIRQYMAPTEQRYLEGMEIAHNATRLSNEDHEELLAQIGAGKLSPSKIEDLTGLSVNDIQNNPETVEPYHLTALRAQYEPVGIRTLADIREMIKNGKLTANNAGVPIDDDSLKQLTSAQAYELIKTHKPYCTKAQRDQIQALMNMQVLRKREVGDLETLTYRDADRLRNKVVGFLSPDERAQFEKTTNNRIEQMRGKYIDDPITVDDHHTNSKYIIAEFVKDQLADRQEVEMPRESMSARVLAATPFHLVIAPNDDKGKYITIDRRETGAKASQTLSDAIAEKAWDSTPRKRGEVAPYTSTDIDGHFVTIVRTKDGFKLDKSLTDSRDGARCEIDAIQQAYAINKSAELKEAAPGLSGLVVAQRGLYHGIMAPDGRTTVVISESLDNPNAGFMEEVALKDVGAEPEAQSPAEPKHKRAPARSR